MGKAYHPLSAWISRRVPLLLLFLLLLPRLGQAQMFYDLSTSDYSQNFANISGWTNNFASGTGAANFRVATSVATSTVNGTTVFATGTAGGVQKGTTQTTSVDNIVLLATGTNSSAFDLLLNFTGRTPGTLSFDYAKVVNGTTSTRFSTLKVQLSTDNGVTFADATGYTLPVVSNSGTAESGAVSIALPVSLTNVSQVVLRFFASNNGDTSGSGNRPKFGLDNVAVTSTPTSPALTATPTALTGFTYVEGAGPSPSQSFNLSGTSLMGAPGNITVTGSTNYEVSTSSNAGFGASVLVAYTGATLAATPVYVRLKSGRLFANSPFNNETIAITGGGDADGASVTASGTVTSASAGVITVTGGPLVAFETIAGTPSTFQTLTVSGTNLGTNNIDITPPVGYEVSVDGGATYLTTVATLPQTGGTVNATAVRVRLTGNTATASLGTSLLIRSLTSPNQDQTVSGTVVPEPTTAPTVVATPSFTSASLTVNAGDGVRRLVVVRLASTTAVPPTDGVVYTANSVFGNAAVGTTTGPGNFVVFSTNLSPATGPVTGLAKGSNYVAETYEFNEGSTTAFNNYLPIAGTATFTTTTPLLGYDFDAGPTAPPTVATNITGSTPFARGSGLGDSPFAGQFSGNGFGAAFDANDYYEFTLGTTGGLQATLTSLSLDNSRSGTGPTSFELRSSLNSFATAIGGVNTVGTTTANQTIALGAAFNAVTTVTFRLYAYGASGSGGTFRVDNVAVFGTVAPPSLSATTVNPFFARAGLNSAAQSYTLTGVNASTSTAVVITAPTGFEVSINGGTSYATMQSFTPATNSFNQTVFVRLSTTATGTPAGDITNTQGALSASVAVTGTVVAEPTTAPTVSTSGAGANVITLTLGGGNGTKRLAVVRVSSVPQVLPVDGTAYAANPNVALSGLTGTGNFVVEAGTATTVNVTGLTSNTNYTVEVYAYNDASMTGFENYLTSPMGSANFSTLAAPLVRWDGGGGNNSWFTPANWDTNTVPQVGEDVLLDHTSVAGPYTVSLDNNTSVVLASLTINPSSGGMGTDSITVLIPSTNTLTTALELTRSGLTETALAIYDKGVFIDNSGSTILNGTPVTTAGSNPTFYIFNGGSYRHYTGQAHTSLVDNLNASAGTERGIFDFRVEDTNYQFLLETATAGVSYGTLILRKGLLQSATTYRGQGLNFPAAVRGNLLVGPNVTLDLRYGNEFRLGGDLRVSGNFTFINFGGGLPKLVLNGTAAQTINGTTLGLTSGLSYLGTGVELVVNNAAGLTLSTPVRINGPLTLTAGIMATSATSLLTLASGYSLTGGSSTSFINGPLARATATGAATTFFPLGKGTAYRPLTLTSTAQTSTTTYTGEITNSTARTSGLTGDLTRVSNIRYATLTPDAAPTGFSGTVTLSFGPDDYVNYPQNLSFVVAKRNGVGNWENMGRTSATGTDVGGGPVSGTLTSGLFTTFSDFALASTAPFGSNTLTTLNPLPVELTRFTAQRQGAGPVAVQWRTASEHNSARFEVERSLDGVRFALVATASAQGTSSQPTAYAVLDQMAPLAGLYYRLRQVDLDGTAVYSAVVRVAAGADVPRLEVYPNPAQSVLHFAVAAATPYRVLTQVGQVRRQGTAAAGLATVPVEGLAPGLYLLELSTPTGRLVQKFEKQ